MKNLVALILFLLPVFAFAQYPANPNKIRLGYQTTADGLIWRGVAADTSNTPTGFKQYAYVVLDTVNVALYGFVQTAGRWQELGGGGGVDSLKLLNDVNTTGATAGSVLKLNSAGVWVDSTDLQGIVAADTAAMLSKYIERGDTATMLAPFLDGGGTNYFIPRLTATKTLTNSRAYTTSKKFVFPSTSSTTMGDGFNIMRHDTLLGLSFRTAAASQSIYADWFFFNTWRKAFEITNGNIMFNGLNNTNGPSFVGINLGSNVPTKVFQVQSAGVADTLDYGAFGGSTDSGIRFLAGRNPYLVSAIGTEVNGRVASYGINVPQFDRRNSTYAGGIFRLDTRASGSGSFIGPEFSIVRYETGSSTAKIPFVVSLETGYIYLPENTSRLIIGASSLPSYSLSNASIDAIGLPRGTTAQRPTVVTASGQPLRYNTDSTRYEGYDGSAWKTLAWKTDATSGTGLTDGDKGDITVSGSGTVWSIDAGVVGADELASTSVTPGSYTNASITVDADGRLTAASSGGSSVTGSGSTNHIAYWTGTSTLSQDASQLYWDATNNRLGIGNAAPSVSLHVTGEARITDLVNGTPTALVGYDVNGNLGTMITGLGIAVSSGSIVTDFSEYTTVASVDSADFVAFRDVSASGDRKAKPIDIIKAADGHIYASNSSVNLISTGLFTDNREVFIWATLTSGAANNATFTIPDPSATYLGRKIYVASDDDSGTYKIIIATANPGGFYYSSDLVSAPSAQDTFDMDAFPGFSTIFVCMQKSTSYYWVPIFQ